jgi:hypothetical protein
MSQVGVETNERLATLRRNINPNLFRLLVQSRLPFSRTEPLEFGVTIRTIFNGSHPGIRPHYDTVWPVLKCISELGLDEVPDLMSFLPPIGDSEFPEQALGLQLLLDQAPRAFCQGVDVRYTYMYFGELAIKFAQQLQTLPEHLNPASWSRWKNIVTIDYFVLVRLWFGAPFAHHEATGKENIAFTNATRKLVEETLGVQDPFRNKPEERWDLYGFPKMLKRMMIGGEPKSPCSLDEGCFFLACLMDVHNPPLERFGRYPYQNDARGRVSTPEEDEWMEKSALFEHLPSEIRETIRRDVKNGLWTPLQGRAEK